MHYLVCYHIQHNQVIPAPRRLWPAAESASCHCSKTNRTCLIFLKVNLLCPAIYPSLKYRLQCLWFMYWCSSNTGVDSSLTPACSSNFVVSTTPQTPSRVQSSRKPIEGGCLHHYTTPKTVLLASRKEKPASLSAKSTYCWMKWGSIGWLLWVCDFKCTLCDKA